MFKIPVVDNCPHTVTGIGTVHLPHIIIASLTGAVQDKDEWMVLLKGERSQDGLVVRVNELIVPRHSRSSTSCELDELEDITPNIVGVLHSHHTMRAFFSTTDDTKLNPRFPVSIVIASTELEQEEMGLLGFSYEAEGRVTLPCGDIGKVIYKVLPDPLPENWPIQAQAHFCEALKVTSFGSCPKLSITQAFLKRTETSKCGLTLDGPAKVVFGSNGTELLKEIESKSVTKTYPMYGFQQAPSFIVNDKRERKQWKKWWKREAEQEQQSEFRFKGTTSSFAQCIVCDERKQFWAMWMNFDSEKGVCLVCKPTYRMKLGYISETP